MTTKTHVAQFNPDATVVGAGQALTISNSVVTLSSSLTIPRPAKAYLIDVQDQPIRFTLAGETPSATVGHRAVATDSFYWPVEWVQSCKMIREGASDAKIYVTPLG